MASRQDLGATEPPFAIGTQNLVERPRSRWRTTMAVSVLGAVLLAGLSGVLGGGSSQHLRAEANGLAGEVIYDPVVRSGNWFETQVTVRASVGVRDLVVAIDTPLWRRMSIDTQIPDADSVEAVDGHYAYHFGEVKAGEVFQLKLDGQIQPGLMRDQAGAIRVLDDERELLAFPIKLRVLP